MKSIGENAAIDFRIAIDSYKHIKGFDDARLAEELGCSAQTISDMRKDPLKGTRGYALILLQKLKIEEKKRYE